ncbi:MAG: DoxX family protein [Acidobacteria bacterium]|nr:DoxX family protein [Acidobacteriota bacterium]
MKAAIEDWYGWFTAASSGLQSPFLLFVRMYWGWQFIVTGWAKVNNIDKVAGFFTTLGIPLPGLSAHFVAGLELVGGILLMLGLGTRLTGLLLSTNMLAAYITADRAALLSFLNDPDKFTSAAPFTFLAASMVALIFGAGLFSVDSWIVWKRRPRVELRHPLARAD